MIEPGVLHILPERACEQAGVQGCLYGDRSHTPATNKVIVESDQLVCSTICPKKVVRCDKAALGNVGEMYAYWVIFQCCASRNAVSARGR